MASSTLISIPKLPFSPQPKQTQFTSQTRNYKFALLSKLDALKLPPCVGFKNGWNHKNLLYTALPLKSAATILCVAGIALATVMVGSDAACASEIGVMGSSLQFNEPSNALSLPTWAIHVSSVVEWITAMALVWQYGEKSGNASWKGLSWGMVPLLGGAFCACTWHFFYNSESLEVLVALQAALTVLGNATMCIAAFRIYRSQEQ
ncbi:Ycf49-like protein [Capsicum chinense]|nr:uncharacterized protein LOC107866791 isoform X1 [Capsicum annuum]KAF3668297.1 Ycf49-like protein [Capsicum annuum]PHU28386.1 Ycf49-like protein [Capsicum chinense]